MARRDPREVYDSLTAAGFDPAAATVMTEIAGAESGWNDAAVGDVRLETSVWGPSVGAYQIRTLKAATGTGGDRDITWLQGNLAHQAQAAYDISRQGLNFTPWTTYVSGAYRKFVAQVTAAVGGPAQASPAPAGGTTVTPVSLQSDTLRGIGGIALTALGALAGAALVGLGVWRLAVRERR